MSGIRNYYLHTIQNLLNYIVEIIFRLEETKHEQIFRVYKNDFY